VQSAQRPGELSNFTRVRSTMIALSGVLAFVALGLLVHVLVSSVRRRRRDVAVLKTLGLRRAQVASVSAWQATTTATLALLVGVPLGIVAGIGLWRVFADRLGVAPEATVPSTVLLAIPVVLVLANLVAVVPALLAARTHPATVLRSE
jgi:ABC-type lipoprotein release transport system permease subunit